MRHKKILVILASLMVLTLLLTIISCAPSTPAPQPSAPSPPPATAVPPPQPTARPTLAPGPIVKIEEPAKDSLIKLVPVAGNASVAMEPNAITTTIKYITDTAKGQVTGTAAMGTTGLPNHPINVPMHIAVNNVDPKNPPKSVKWTLAGPAGNKAKLANDTALATEFTPDVAGIYRLGLAVTDAANVTKNDAVQIHAGTYIGVTAGNCSQCHPQKVAEWSKTGHAVIFSDEIDNKRDAPNSTHYSETCTRCHTTGWFAPPYNGAGGFYDVKTKAGWNFPTFEQINRQNNWAGVPAEIKNMANIQCEDCHGPAKEHVTQGARVMVSSQDEGVCNICHNGGGHHLKGTDLKSAKHAEEESAAFNAPIGPTRQACVRCHSGDGYVSFLKDPKNEASWANEKQTVVCATCHDPHDEANAFQLRIVGKPVEITFDAKDVGLSATCYECHNARTKPADAIRSSFPHYSSVAEFISDTGGVTYGASVPNSPHAQIVGGAPIPNPEFAKNPATNQFMFSKVGDKKGNAPGPCVTCHMWPTIEDTKDPNFHKVGSHSFNTVSPDGKLNYTAACQSCHAGIKDFNFTAKADYDGNGKAEGVQTEVKGLLNVLWKALEAKGFKKVDTGYPYATLPRDAQGNVDDKIDNAWYNFRTVYGVMWGAETGNGNEGKAQAVHNFKRAVALLQLSIKDLAGSLPAGAVEMK